MRRDCPAAADGSGGMGMSFAAAQPCVIFGGTTEMPGENLQSGQPGGNGQPNGKEPPSGEERPDGEDRVAQGGFGGQKPDGSTPSERQEGEDSQNNGSDAKA